MEGIDLETLKGYGGYFGGFVTATSIALAWWKGLPVVVTAIGGRDAALRDHYDREIKSLELRMADQRREMDDRYNKQVDLADKRYRECQADNDRMRAEHKGETDILRKMISDLQAQIVGMQRQHAQEQITILRAIPTDVIPQGTQDALRQLDRLP